MVTIWTAFRRLGHAALLIPASFWVGCAETGCVETLTCPPALPDAAPSTELGDVRDAALPRGDATLRDASAGQRSDANDERAVTSVARRGADPRESAMPGSRREPRVAESDH